MRRRISKIDFEEFISKNFNSKLEFSKSLMISYSHLDSLLKGNVLLGNKVYKRLENICRNFNTDIESILEPLPLTNIKEIIVKKDDDLVVSITSRDVIEKDGFNVVCVPYVLKD